MGNNQNYWERFTDYANNYLYAFNLLTTKPGESIQPGDLIKQIRPVGKISSFGDLMAVIKSEIELKKLVSLAAVDTPEVPIRKGNEYRYNIAIACDTAGDQPKCVFYRQNADGQWWLKEDLPGRVGITDLDASGQKITDPKHCSRDYTSLGWGNFNDFCGYVQVKYDSRYRSSAVDAKTSGSDLSGYHYAMKILQTNSVGLTMTGAFSIAESVMDMAASMPIKWYIRLMMNDLFLLGSGRALRRSSLAENPAPGEYKIAVAYHSDTVDGIEENNPEQLFYIQNQEGDWSCLPNSTIGITNLDASGSIIKNPETSDRSYSGKNYKGFYGYYIVSYGASPSAVKMTRNAEFILASTKKHEQQDQFYFLSGYELPFNKEYWAKQKNAASNYYYAMNILAAEGKAPVKPGAVSGFGSFYRSKEEEKDDEIRPYDDAIISRLLADQMYLGSGRSIREALVPDSPLYRGEYLVAIARAGISSEYLFYRHDQGSGWSLYQDFGDQQGVTCYDANGDYIVDPSECSKDYRALGGLDYSTKMIYVIVGYQHAVVEADRIE